MSRCAPSWHEPPIATLLPDREALTAVIEDMFQTYQREGKGHGMAKFIALVSHDARRLTASRSRRWTPHSSVCPSWTTAAGTTLCWGRT